MFSVALTDKELTELLASGGVLVFPTETQYAVGGCALNSLTHQRIIELKQRNRAKVFPLLIDGQNSLAYVEWPSERLQSYILKKFWPGPLTLVLRCGADLPAFVGDNHGRVAVRWSSSSVVSRLLRCNSGRPIIGTSANLSGEGGVNDLKKIKFLDAVDHAIDGGVLVEQPPSTIVDVTVKPFQIIRQGLLTVNPSEWEV